jgi:hypothetical protein
MVETESHDRSPCLSRASLRTRTIFAGPRVAILADDRGGVLLEGSVRALDPRRPPADPLEGGQLATLACLGIVGLEVGEQMVRPVAK